MLRTRSGLPKHCCWAEDRHGKRRVRFRKAGFTTYLTGTPWSEDFMRQYAVALDGVKAIASEARKDRVIAGTVNALCISYYKSPDFRSLKPSTQTMRRNIIENFRNDHGDKPAAKKQLRSGDAAQHFLGRLTPADRSALVLMPVGAGIPFTADHARVQAALEQANGLATLTTEVRNLGMEEIRAIASGDFLTLNNVAARECADRPMLSGPSSTGQSGQGGQATGGVGPPQANAPSAFDSRDSCTRQIEAEARTGWQQLRTNTLASTTPAGVAVTRRHRSETEG
jgi:hypothetical protein